MKKIIAIVSTLFFTYLVSQSAYADETTIASGTLSNSFSSWGSPSLKGDWQIVEEDGSTYLQLGDSYKAKEGPDVKVFLSPLATDQIDGDNASTGSLFVSLIDNFEGKTQIEIPAGTDLSQYQSLVFHCEAYSKLWGVSPL